MIRYRTCLVLLLFAGACATRPAPRLSFPTPAELWAPDVVSTAASEVRITFSPDGRRMLWGTIGRAGGPGGWDIFESVREGDGWSAPQPAGFDSPANDFDPAFAPDGSGVYFFSNREGGVGKDDLYFAPWDAAGGAWGPARNLGAGINTAEDEWAPVVSPDGRLLLFASDGRGGLGKHDLFVCERAGAGWGTPRNLGPGVNTAREDFDAAFLQDGRTLVLTSGDFDQDDVHLYLARMGRTGRTLLSPEVNESGAWSFGPAISARDPGFLYFTSSRAGGRGRADIYRIALR